jgi:hypothetical protein
MMATTRPDPVRGYAFDDKVVLAYYYMWYTEERWIGAHGEGGRRELEGLHSLVGAYNSWNPSIIERHMQQLKRAKIDCIACSWWWEEGERGMNAKLDTVFAKARDHGIVVTIDFEHGGAPLDQVYRDLRYFLSRYRDHPALLKVEGDAVVMVWTSWAHTPREWEEIWGRLEAEGLRSFPIISGGFDTSLKAEFTTTYLGPFRSLEQYTLVDVEDCQLARYMQRMRRAIDDYNQRSGFETGRPAQHHATISPGYDETRNPSRKFSAGGVLGAGWKDRGKFGVHYPDDTVGAYYRGTFEAAMSSNPDWLHVSTFNELYEWSHIEATVEFGYRYLDLTAEFVEAFKGRGEDGV